MPHDDEKDSIALSLLVTCQLLQRIHMLGLACNVSTAWCMVVAMHFDSDALKYERASLCRDIIQSGHAVCTFVSVIEDAVEVVMQMPLMGLYSQVSGHSF